MVRFLLSLLLIITSLSATWGQGNACFERDSLGDIKISYLPTSIGAKGFVIGELDEVTSVPAMKLALIKYLYEKEGVRDIFMEIGHSAAWYYQDFLETGDSTVVTQPTLVYNSTPEGKKFWQQLFMYNQSIGKKLRIHGMDFERMEFLKLLKELGDPNRQRPRDIREILEYMDTVKIAIVNNPQLTEIYEQFTKAYRQYPVAFESYYREEVHIVKKILTNPSSYAHYRDRNNGMFENIAHWQSNNQGLPFVVFVGEKHISGLDSTSLASRLKQSKNGGSIKTYALVAETRRSVQDRKRLQLRGPGAYVENKSTVKQLRNKSRHCHGTGLSFPTSAINDDQIRRFSDFILYLKDNRK